jgi:FG-GAP-like repeat
MPKLCTAALLFLTTASPLLAQNLPPYKAGFPLTLPGQEGVNTKPALADLKIPGDTAGVKSIVFVGNNGNLHVIHRTSPTTWAEAPGFPVQVGAKVLSSPAVGDLTGDGVPEIVVGYGDPFVGSLLGGVKAFRNNGALLWDRPSNDRDANGHPDAVVGTPAIGDVDGDGLNDVVWGSIDFKIYFVSGSNGANKPNWPRDALDSILSSPVLHDMDGDGRPEIIVGVDAHADATFGTPNGGCLHVMSGAQPVIPTNPFPANVGYPVDLPGFPKCVNQVIYTDPVVGDIDGDGHPEIVHGTGNFYAGATKAVYAWKCDGTAVPGWPVALSGQTQFGSSLALANLDSDAALEVVLGVDTTNQLYAIKGNGTVIFAKAPKNYFGSTTNVGSPLVADVLGSDSAPEILVPTNTEIAVFDAAGTQLTDAGAHTAAPSFYTQTGLTNASVGDLDPGDGKIEVVAVSAAPFSNPVNTEIHVWNPISRATAPAWGLYRQNAERTGEAPGTPACRTYGTCPTPPAAPRFNTISPCRVVDTRGTAGVPIGGPSLASNGLRDFLLRGKCNVPSTAKALSLNITVVFPTGSGFVRFAPSCQMPTASTINFSPGQTRANNAILQLGNSDGVLTANAFIAGGGTVELLVDVNGYFQ